MGFFRPSVEFAVRVDGEQARVEGECVLLVEDEYCNHTRRGSDPDRGFG